MQQELSPPQALPFTPSKDQLKTPYVTLEGFGKGLLVFIVLIPVSPRRLDVVPLTHPLPLTLSFLPLSSSRMLKVML